MLWHFLCFVKWLLNIGTVPYKACKTRSIWLTTVKLCEILHETYTETQTKLQGPLTLRDDPVWIFRGLNFHDAYCSWEMHCHDSGVCWNGCRTRKGSAAFFRISTGCNTHVCTIWVVIVKLAHAIGRVLKRVEIRAGRWETFGMGVAVPFVAPLPASGSRAPTSVTRGGCNHRVVAALSIPQGVRGSNCVRGCLVVPCAYRFSHRRRQANEKHG